MRTWKDYTPKGVCARAAESASEIARASVLARDRAHRCSSTNDTAGLVSAIGTLHRLSKAAGRVVAIFHSYDALPPELSRTLH